tara:strand:+ start:13341 stop:13916 length:576 start_codon:yes stop_codon:yes gene_type:complete
MNQNKKIGIGIALTLGIVSTIWAGFDQTYGYVTRCEVRASNYVEAEYSKTDTYPCTDINGNSGLCTDTDYWDEPASDVFEAVTVDGQLVQAYPEDVVFKTQGGYYNVPTPPYDQSMSRDYDFDRFSFHNDIEHIVYTMKTVVEDGIEKQVPDYNTKSADFYHTCNKLREQGNAMTIKTWYGLSYNVEETTE